MNDIREFDPRPFDPRPFTIIPLAAVSDGDGDLAVGDLCCTVVDHCSADATVQLWGTDGLYHGDASCAEHLHIEIERGAHE